MVVLRKRPKSSARSESNDSDCIVLNDERPARNVNGMFIDLTENSSQNANYEPPKKAMKLTKYNRIESPSSTPKQLQKKAAPNVLISIDLSNDQPTCSRNLSPSPSNTETRVKVKLAKESKVVPNVQLGNNSQKASSSISSRREPNVQLGNNSQKASSSSTYRHELNVQLGNNSPKASSSSTYRHELNVQLGNNSQKASSSSTYRLEPNVQLNNNSTKASSSITSRREPNVQLGNNSTKASSSSTYRHELNVQLGNNSQKASSSITSRRESFSLIPCLLGMDLDFIPNMKPFECKICFETIEPGDGIILYECLHEFCKDCLSGLIESAEEFQVKCPWDKCQEFLREREIKSLVSNEVFEKHLHKSLKIAEHGNELSFHCRTPDCPVFMEIGADVPNFMCPSCKKVNCISCKAIHEGKSCKDYQEEINPKLKNDRLNNENLQSEDAIKQLIATNQAMYCPKCSIPVMKISGCDFISCSACKLGICWVTKKPRKDLKKADGTIIEGCKCKEPPLMKRCHPKCGHCH